jgi:hypothetical protein
MPSRSFTRLRACQRQSFQSAALAWLKKRRRNLSEWGLMGKRWILRVREPITATAGSARRLDGGSSFSLFARESEVLGGSLSLEAMRSSIGVCAPHAGI